jgi:tetratricopeptide (TPR) repeat protein
VSQRLKGPGKGVWLRMVSLLLLAGAAATAGAAPYLPASDEVILETLPIRYDPALAELTGLRGQWLRNPAQLSSAIPLVRAYISAARRNGDPRFLGYAQATLARWGEDDRTPPDVRVLRATILQSLHQFADALHELDLVLARQPQQAQALLTRATILQVQGRFAEAQRDCSRLWLNAGEVTTELCLANVASLTGRLQAAAGLARRALASAPDSDTISRLWAQTLLAEIAARQGESELARVSFQAALKTDPTDRYVRAALCDVLLDQGRAGEVLALTADLTRDDNLLLRRALALQALASAPAASKPGTEVARALRESIGLLQERHAAAKLRGDATHLREAARMTLELLHEPAASLALARANWAVQKEPADARILLQAALAARDDTVRLQLQAWLRASGLIDAHLNALLHS